MSLKAITVVFEHSKATLGARLVMLAIADYAKDDGSNAWPSIQALATKSNLSERQVQRNLKLLIESKELQVRYKEGPKGTNFYDLLVGPFAPNYYQNVTPTICHPDILVTPVVTFKAENDTKMSPEPSYKPSREEPSVSLRPKHKSAVSETSPPKPNKILNYTEQDLQLAKLLHEEIKKRDPQIRSPNFGNWAATVNAIHRLDNRSYEQIEQAIRWSQQDDFWKTNILSTESLRKQFAKLVAKMSSNGAAKPNNSYSYSDEKYKAKLNRYKALFGAKGAAQGGT